MEKKIILGGLYRHCFDKQNFKKKIKVINIDNHLFGKE